MAWVPTHKLYQSDGATLVYTFEHVLDLPEQLTDNPSSVELSNLRSQGSIVIPGGDKAYKFRVKGIVIADDYTSLIIAIKALNTAITNNTRFVLKIDTSISTTDNYNVKRIVAIDWYGQERKTKLQYYTVEFLAKAW